MAWPDKSWSLNIRGAILPHVQLMHGLVVDVRTKTLGDVEAISLSLGCLTEALLFVADVMLCACNDSSILNASNSGIDQGASQIWIRTKSFLDQSLDDIGLHSSSHSPSSCHLLENGPRVRILGQVAHRHLYHGAPNPSLDHAHKQGHETK